MPLRVRWSRSSSTASRPRPMCGLAASRANCLEQGKIKEISDELSLDMYNVLIDRLTAAGYEHYEISNFALPGFRSRHNSSYWHDIPYLGIGASAHSYNKATRSWNVDNIKKYIEAISNDILPSESEIIDSDTHYDDLITTALRTKEGININGLEEKYRHHLLTEAQRHIAQGLLTLTDNRLSLSRKGLYVSDMVMSDLMM